MAAGEEEVRRREVYVCKRSEIEIEE